MGSSGSKSSSATEMIAQWRSRHKCSCSQNNYYVIKISWISVPMAGEAWVTLGRVAALGLLEIIHKFKEYSHDVVQLRIKCRRCDTIMIETMDFSNNGKQRRWGHYGRIKETFDAKTSKITSFPYRLASESYKKMRNYGYDLGDYNCKDWA